MKYVCSAFSLKIARIFIICLALSLKPVSAEHAHQHSSAPTFSDPSVLTTVSKDWQNKTFKHDPVHSGADLVVALSQQSYPIFHKMILQYADKNKLKIIVKPGTCGITAGRLRKKSADIGAYCCPPAKADRLPGLKFHSLGISPIALIVHPDNPIENITAEQAREIFKGNTTHWTQIEDNNKAEFQHLIKPIARLHCKVRPGHWRALLNSENQFSPRLFEVGVIPDMISQVARNSGGIGWEVPLMLKVHSKKGAVKMLKIDGHKATDLEHVLSGKYPLYRSYSLTTWEKNAGNQKDNMHSEATKLVRHLQQHIEKIHTEVAFVPPSQLRRAGWKFKEDELIGEPGSK